MFKAGDILQKYDKSQVVKILQLGGLKFNGFDVFNCEIIKSNKEWQKSGNKVNYVFDPSDWSVLKRKEIHHPLTSIFK